MYQAKLIFFDHLLQFGTVIGHIGCKTRLITIFDGFLTKFIKISDIFKMNYKLFIYIFNF